MPSFVSAAVAENVAISLALLCAMFVCRSAAEWAVSRRAEGLDARRRRFTVRALANLLVSLALVAVWMSEIQNLVFSLAAVMVALVVATKELIMCVAGAVLRFGGQLFKVGDRIEVNGLHGEVIDHGLFSTTILELPPAALGHAGTGRRLVLPNSALLSGTVRVEAQPRQFAPHRFAIVLEHPVPVAAALERLNAAAESALRPDAERAARFHRMTALRQGVEIAGPGHAVTLATTELGKLQFNVMLYCLAQDAGALQHQVTLGFLSDAALATAAPAPARTAPAAADPWPEVARRLLQPQPRSNAA